MFGSGGSHILKFNRNQLLERRSFKNISNVYGESERELGVKEDRPAANAKLQEGDIVIKLGDIDVVDMMSYMKGLSAFKKGDKTTVVVKRGEKTLKRKVQF